MTTLKQNPLILATVLIVGAMIYSRSASARALRTTNAPGNPTSLPGSVGSGTNQIIGGALGAFFNSLKMPMASSGDTTSGITPDQQAQVDFRKGEILQENTGYTTNYSTGLTDGEQAQIDLSKQEILDMNDTTSAMGFDGMF